MFIEKKTIEPHRPRSGSHIPISAPLLRPPIKKIINQKSITVINHLRLPTSASNFMLNPNFNNRKSNTKLTSVRSHVYRKEENRIPSTPEWVVHPGLGSARPPIKKILTKNPSPSSTTSGSHASNFMLYLNFNYRKSITKLTSARSYILGG